MPITVIQVAAEYSLASGVFRMWERGGRGSEVPQWGPGAKLR